MALSRVLLRRAGALALAATLALSTGAAAVLAADPPTTSDPGAAAAGWIAGQVDAGVGPGSLADAIFAYASTGTGANAAADALARLENVVDSYILDGSAALVPGYLAKTLLAVQVAGGDPTSFGGHDLEAELRSLIVTTPGAGPGPLRRRTPVRPGARRDRPVADERRRPGRDRRLSRRASSARTATSSGTPRAPARVPRTPTRPASRCRPCWPVAPPRLRPPPPSCSSTSRARMARSARSGRRTRTAPGSPARRCAPPVRRAPPMMRRRSS